MQVSPHAAHAIRGGPAQHSFANPVVKLRLLDFGSQRVGSAVCRTVDSIYELNLLDSILDIGSLPLFPRIHALPFTP